MNKSNLPIIIRQILTNNIVRGHDILARALVKAQIASPSYTFVYATLVSIINRKFPQVGKLISKRLISSFLRLYQCNDKSNCLASAKFLAHLINQNIVCSFFNKQNSLQLLFFI